MALLLDDRSERSRRLAGDVNVRRKVKKKEEKSRLKTSLCECSFQGCPEIEQSGYVRQWSLRPKTTTTAQ